MSFIKKCSILFIIPLLCSFSPQEIEQAMEFPLYISEDNTYLQFRDNKFEIFNEDSTIVSGDYSICTMPNECFKVSFMQTEFLVHKSSLPKQIVVNNKVFYINII